MSIKMSMDASQEAEGLRDRDDGDPEEDVIITRNSGRLSDTYHEFGCMHTRKGDLDYENVKRMPRNKAKENLFRPCKFCVLKDRSRGSEHCHGTKTEVEVMIENGELDPSEF